MIKREKKIIKDINIPQKAVVYDNFAPYYDKYMRHVDYDKWVKKILDIYSLHSSSKLTDILELACGTCNVSQKLVGMGYKVTATDRSMQMLKYAEQKPNAPKLYLSVMTDPLPEASYDLILLVFDSINYLLEYTDVSTLLSNISIALKKGGLFIFDISTYKNSSDNFDDYTHVDDSINHCLIHRAEFDHIKRLQKTRITIFQKQDNHYFRMDEEHIQKVYYVHELLQLCDSSPIECTGIYSQSYDKNLLKTNTKKLDHQYSRLFFVLKNK